MSMGVGIAIYLIQEIFNNAFIDLDAHDQQRRSTDSAAYSKASEEAIQQPSRRKRKHPTTTGSLADQSDRGGPEVERSQNLTPIVVRIAALEALEALLTVGGALRSDSWRSSVDHLIMTVATNACKEGWGREKNISVYGDASHIWADFQLAALRALLASLLSPGRVRPPHLAQSLDLFRRVKSCTQETGTKIAQYCSHALLTLEVLIHPRALLMIDFQSPVDHYDVAGIKIPENMYSSGHRQNIPFHVGTAGKGPSVAESDEDELYQSWLGNGDEKEVSLADLQNNARNAEKASSTSKHPSFEKFTSDFPSDANSHEGNKLGATAGDATVRISEDRNEMMIEFQNQETIKQSKEHDHTKGGNSVSIIGTQTALGSDKVASDSGTLEHMDPASTSGKDVFVAEREVVTTIDNITAPTKGKDIKMSHGDGYDTILENISSSVSNKDSRKAIVYEMDADSSVESLPDIVDGDPDSDS